MIVVGRQQILAGRGIGKTPRQSRLRETRRLVAVAKTAGFPKEERTSNSHRSQLFAHFRSILRPPGLTRTTGDVRRSLSAPVESTRGDGKTKIAIREEVAVRASGENGNTFRIHREFHTVRADAALDCDGSGWVRTRSVKSNAGRSSLPALFRELMCDGYRCISRFARAEVQVELRKDVRERRQRAGTNHFSVTGHAARRGCRAMSGHRSRWRMLPAPSPKRLCVIAPEVVIHQRGAGIEEIVDAGGSVEMLRRGRNRPWLAYLQPAADPEMNSSGRAGRLP